ncbi:MAG: addiction module protein [Kiritimatiellae bacterium]|jgi:putative addiction module component (TIGR02574 family)|nr:addiction module protein [Kiritimatiellia bacterium]
MTTVEMETVLKMPMERRILWVEDIWDSIRPQSDKLQVPFSHKRELDLRIQKYSDDRSALLSEQQLKNAVNSRA